jgi:cytosolic carboxypeptidase protein 2/3
MGNTLQAKELRKRIIFLIVPMINVDGVIIGNYRTSMSGNDLNRKYIDSDKLLHPEVCYIKSMIHDLVRGKKKEKDKDGKEIKQEEIVIGPEILQEEVMCFADMHGHSRKKNVFVYGP